MNEKAKPMVKNGYVTVPELAKILGLSRIAVYKQVRKGQIKAVRIGRNYAISRKYVEGILGKTLGSRDKKQIDAAVKKVVSEYGSVLKMLGRE
jgi:excisionase family DNA binding protein